jgi:hypothetical protein
VIVKKILAAVVSINIWMSPAFAQKQSRHPGNNTNNQGGSHFHDPSTPNRSLAISAAGSLTEGRDGADHRG